MGGAGVVVGVRGACWGEGVEEEEEEEEEEGGRGGILKTIQRERKCKHWLGMLGCRKRREEGGETNTPLPPPKKNVPKCGKA